MLISSFHCKLKSIFHKSLKITLNILAIFKIGFKIEFVKNVYGKRRESSFPGNEKPKSLFPRNADTKNVRLKKNHF